MDSGFLFIIFQFVVLIFSVMIHEISHGFVAEKLGDDTARMAGRLTLNPLRHIDLFGSIILPLLLFITHSPVVLGWAKPVPYNPYKLSKDFVYGPLKVALAGPASNLLILIVLGLVARFSAGSFSPQFIGLLGFIALMNTYLAVFNLLPIPPLDGSKILPLLFPKIAGNIERVGSLGLLLVFAFLYLFSRVIFYVSIHVFYWIAGGQVLGITQSFLNAMR